MLGGCLDSLRGHVDEVVVVDTGSVDATPEIAKSSGAQLLFFEWTGDFAAARNCGLNAATGDWVLYIDADERLQVPAGRTLRDAISLPGHAAFNVKFRYRLGYSPYAELRLFLCDERIRFESRIHESISPSLMRVCSADGLRVGMADVTIQHLGYEGDLSPKHSRNLPLLLRAVEEYPDRVYLWWNIGFALAETGDKEGAERALRTAITTARRTGSQRDRAEGATAAAALARLYLESGAADNALHVLDEGDALWPKDASLTLYRGRALIDLGRYSEAQSVLSRLLLVDPESVFDPYKGYDLRIFGEMAHSLIGLAAFRQGRYPEARDAYLAAAARSSEPDAYRAKAVVAEARANL